MATPAPPPRAPLGFSYLFLLAAFVESIIAAISLLWPLGGVTVLIGLGLLAVALALYFGSLLVP